VRSRSTHRHGRDSLDVIHARDGDLVDGNVVAHGDGSKENGLKKDKVRGDSNVSKRQWWKMLVVIEADRSG
jgi:hypothetical protein